MKRISMLFVAVLCCLGVVAEKINVTIKGTASPNSKSVEVFVNADRRSAATVSVTNNAFTYTASVEKESFLTIVEDGSKNIAWAVADGNSVTVDMLKASASGTVLTDKLNMVCDSVNKYSKSENECRKIAKEETDEVKAALLRTKAREYRRTYRNILDSAIENNKDNCLPAALMFLYAGLGMSDQTLVTYGLGDYPFTKHPLFVSMKQYVQQVKAANAYVGKKYNDFSANDITGKTHKLSEYVGKGSYTLIDFWASWCGPCMKEMPVLKNAMKRYGRYGFNIVGVSLDNDAARWQGAIKNTGLDWVHLSNLVGWDEPALAWYGVRSIPSNFLCNADGVIVAVNLRGEYLMEKLEDIYDVK